MNKLVTLFLLVVSWLLIGTNQAWSYPVADSVRYPLDDYVVGENDFGAYSLVREDKWHLGDDVSATAGTNVFAIGNGIVRHAAIHTGYGGMYIIEHNVNGEKVCALYVHMNFATFTKSAWQEVTKGEYLGRIGGYSQNGGWPPHFHGGIRKGAYPDNPPDNPNEYIYGDWIFSGYTANESVLDDWHNPTHFLIAHSSLVGNFGDGSFSDQIIDCYYQHGGHQVFGNPVPSLVPYSDGYVTEWPWPSGYLFQVFDGGSLGNCAIVFDTQAGVSQAFPMHGQIWDYYKAYGGPYLLIEGTRIGGPIDQERYAVSDVNGHELVVQQMANGYLVYDTVTGFTDAVSDSSGFQMALIPSDDDLVLSAWPSSTTSVFLGINDIGASLFS